MTDKICENATKHAIAAAKEAGTLISFDPNLRKPLWKSMDDAKEKISWGLSQCDILKISDDEIEFMTGEKDIKTGVKKLIDQYHIPFICATMGKTEVWHFLTDISWRQLRSCEMTLSRLQVQEILSVHACFTMCWSMVSMTGRMTM